MRKLDVTRFGGSFAVCQTLLYRTLTRGPSREGFLFLLLAFRYAELVGPVFSGGIRTKTSVCGQRFLLLLLFGLRWCVTRSVYASEKERKRRVFFLSPIQTHKARARTLLKHKLHRAYRGVDKVGKATFGIVVVKRSLRWLKFKLASLTSERDAEKEMVEKTLKERL